MNRFDKFYESEPLYYPGPASFSMDTSDPFLNREEAEDLCKQAYEKQMQGQLEEAIELYNQSLSLCPTAEAHTFLGWAFATKGQFEEAITECQKAIGLDPDFGNPYNDIGAYLIEIGKEDEAVLWLEKATQAPRYDAYFYAYYNLGKVREKQGKWFEAFEAYSKALEHNPEYTLAKDAMGRLNSWMN